MKAILAEVGVVLAEVLAVVAVLFFIYKKWLAPAAAAVPSAAEVKQGLSDIATGLPGAVGNVLTGNDGSGYMTTEQQRANAAANLAAHNAALAGGW